MFWRKKKLIPFVKKQKTLEEVAYDGRVGDVYYFRIEIDELVLYAKTPIGYNTSRYKLPLRCINITKISTRCKGNKKFWEKEMILALRRHWEKYELS